MNWGWHPIWLNGNPTLGDTGRAFNSLEVYYGLEIDDGIIFLGISVNELGFRWEASDLLRW